MLDDKTLDGTRCDQKELALRQHLSLLGKLRYDVTKSGLDQNRILVSVLDRTGSISRRQYPSLQQFNFTPFSFGTYQIKETRRGSGIAQDSCMGCRIINGDSRY